MQNAAWLARQFPPETTIAGVLTRAGWIHTAGGTGPYLSLKARLPAIDRRRIDDSVYRRLEVVELLCVRDSMMLIPRADVAVALAAGRRSFDRWMKKLPVERREIQRLADRVLKTLGDGVHSADALRNEIPARFIRSLGEEGTRLGFATTLPIALRLLQVQGRVLRFAEEFRLDAKLYLYRRWPDSVPRADPPGDLDRALAERFLTWAAPATVDDFAFWAGIGKSAAKKALAAASPPAPPSGAAPEVVFLPFRDNVFSLHRGLSAFATGIELLDYSNKSARVEQLESLHHNAIVVGGELRGIWEYDPADGRIVWRLFRKTRGVEEVAAEAEAFIREELGDHKFYAFDRGRTRELRLAFVRKA